jgi:hypothetical protein
MAAKKSIAHGAKNMGKLKLVTSEKNSTVDDRASQTREELMEMLVDMLSEVLPETDDFQEFENAALEAGNELVRQALKKS